MIFIFALSCFALALIYLGGLLVYRRNGPSHGIGRFSNVAVIIYGGHVLIAIGTLATLLVKNDVAALLVTLAILASPLIIAASFSFRRAGGALALQILILTTGGLWLIVTR